MAGAKGGTETKVDAYNGCHENAQVVLYSLKGAGNTWPGGEQYEVEKTVGKTSPDPNANNLELFCDAQTAGAEQRSAVDFSFRVPTSSGIARPSADGFSQLAAQDLS